MNKWKDTARTSKEIIKNYASGETTVLPENSLVIIEKALSEELFLVTNTPPKKSDRRRFKIKKSEVVIEDYTITKDINIQMLLADGWDAQDLLRQS
jgi:hypothetical protein